MSMEFCYIDYLEKGKTDNCEYFMGWLDKLREEIKKKCLQMQKKKFSFTKTMHVPDVCKKRDEIDLVTLRITLPQSVYFRSDFLNVCRLQRNAPEKEIWLKCKIQGRLDWMYLSWLNELNESISQIEWVALRTALPPPYYSDLIIQWLLAVCRP